MVYVALFTASNSLLQPSSCLWWSAGSLVFALQLDYCSTSGPTLSGWHPLRHHLLPLLPNPGCSHTCMSVASVPGSIEITVQLGELTVTVRGPAVQASELVSEISRNYSSETQQESSPAPSESHYSLVEAPSRNTATTTPIQTPGPRLETRDVIERSFDPCPDYLLSLGNRLGGCISWTSQGRILRAWKAGQWAKAVLDRRSSSPNRTPPIDLKARIYVILRCENLAEPVCYQSSSSYWRAIGSLERSSSISHSWPSEAEARTYCSGAGIAFPRVLP